VVVEAADEELVVEQAAVLHPRPDQQTSSSSHWMVRSNRRLRRRLRNKRRCYVSNNSFNPCSGSSVFEWNLAGAKWERKAFGYFSGD